MSDPKFFLTPEARATIEEASKAQRKRLQELRENNHAELCKLPGGMPEDDPFFEEVPIPVPDRFGTLVDSSFALGAAFAVMASAVRSQDDQS